MLTYKIEVEGPPMIWDTGAGTFIVDDDLATAQGWRSEIRGTTVVWLRELSELACVGCGRDDYIICPECHENGRAAANLEAAQRERVERDAELAKEYGDLP